MKLVTVQGSSEKLFWQFVTEDFREYYFFIYDWLLQREKSQVVLALDGETIAGLLLVNDNKFVQLRGSPQAAELLLDSLDLTNLEVMAPLECEKQVLKKYPSPKQKWTITLMSVDKGQEKLTLTEKRERLTVADVDEIALLMRKNYPEMWSEITAENVKELFSSNWALWLGTRQEGKLAAFGYTMLTPQASHIVWVATAKEYRNKGYGKTIVSALVKECLGRSQTAIIYVADNNENAKKVYTEVGFKPYKSYLLLKT
jgi:predicted GNAT family acetyltransferase